MGIFILMGICALLAAKVLLLTKILWTRNCTGISGKTQVLYAIIFAGRYLDVVTTYYACPFTVSLTKIGFTVLTYCTVLSIFFFYYESYQRQYDKFRIELLILPCVVLSLLANNGFELVEVFWAFSVYLEAVSILPQIYMSSRIKYVEHIVYYYITALSIYKVFHLMDGMYRFYMNQPYDRITLAAGVVQLMFYCDFFLKDLPMRGELINNDSEISISVVVPTNNFYSKEQEAMRSAELNNYHDNLREVVLTPESLSNDDDKKTTKHTDQKEQEVKSTDNATVRA